MSTTPPNQPPFDPTNVNDPRYNASRDPRFDPRWQKAQQRFYRDQQRAVDHQSRAAQKAQAAAWKAQAKAQRDQWKMYWHGQRRTSIVGPLLLISVGLIFFLIHSGRVSAVGFYNWYGHWWPLLLIAVGLLRLAEWAIDRSRAPQDAPPMRYTMGGGVVSLLILLAVVGLATHSMDWHADRNGLQFFGFRGNGMDHLFGQKHEEDAPALMRDVSSTGSLSIDSPHGDVTVSGTSDDGKIHLSVHKQVYTNSDDTATQRLAELTPVFDGSTDSLSLRVPATQGGSADIVLLVPATVRVVLNSNRGDVHVRNLRNSVIVTANNGEVEVAAITGAVQLHVNNRHHDSSVRNVSGDVSVDGSGDQVTLTDVAGNAAINGDFFGGGQMQRIGGGVQYHSSRTDLNFAHLYGDFSIDGDDLQANQVVGPSLVSTRSRNIVLSKITGDLKVVNNHGDVKLDAAPPIGTLTVDSQNGTVSVSLPEKAKFTFQGETSDGEVHSDFDGIRSDGRGTLTGSANGGGAQVRINTSHGDITISRNEVTPLVAPPPPPRLSGSMPPLPPLPPDADAMSRDAMTVAAAALKQSADAVRNAQTTSDAKARAQQALEEARQAMKDAQEKQKEAARLAREAAKQK